MPSARPAGGGGGFPNLGPAPNTFASNAARNTQAATATWLAQYDADRSLHIRVGPNVQRRNAAGDGWEQLRWS